MRSNFVKRDGIKRPDCLTKLFGTKEGRGEDNKGKGGNVSCESYLHGKRWANGRHIKKNQRQVGGVELGGKEWPGG